MNTHADVAAFNCPHPSLILDYHDAVVNMTLGYLEDAPADDLRREVFSPRTLPLLRSGSPGCWSVPCSISDRSGTPAECSSQPPHTTTTDENTAVSDRFCPVTEPGT